MSHIPDETNERNHVFRWRSSKPPSGNYIFKEKSFTVPDIDYYETPLMYFKMFWNDELTELIDKQTFTVSRNLERQSKLSRRKLNNSSVFKCTCLF